MRIPDIFFPVINFAVTILLRSPIHGVASDSLMIIHFRGRRSGKQFSTPVRYNQADNAIHCFTAKTNNWWKNIRSGEELQLFLSGRSESRVAHVITDHPATIRAGVESLLANYPADAPYYEIRQNKDKSFDESDLERASRQTIMVEIRQPG